MSKPKIKVKATCPDLCPKSKPDDMNALKKFYKQVDERLTGIGDDMAGAKCTKMIIEIEVEDLNAAG